MLFATFAIVVNLTCELFGVADKILAYFVTSTWQQRFANTFTPGEKPGFPKFLVTEFRVVIPKLITRPQENPKRFLVWYRGLLNIQ